MVLNFPDWSDLGNTSHDQQNTWSAQTMRRAKQLKYFDGSVFEERVPSEDPLRHSDILLYPVGINLTRMLCLSQADNMFGEWEDTIVTFSTTSDSEPTTSEKAAMDLMDTIMATNNADKLLWEVALDSQIFGSSVLSVAPASPLGTPGHIRLSRIPMDGFYPVFDPDDPDVILEAWIAVKLTKEQARIKYRVDTDKDTIDRVEHWTPSLYENFIDGKRVSALSGKNPWGFVPFVIFRRHLSTSIWGDALTDDIIPIQDELNMRLADIGEVINYNTHAVRWGKNLPAMFNAENFPIGPNVFWDLGRGFSGQPDPEVGTLEIKNPIPSGAWDYINFLYDWARTSSFAPPIAFGEDNGGGQRSGITLEIRLRPLIRAMVRTRSYFRSSMMRVMRMIAVILSQKKLGSQHALNALSSGALQVNFASILPRDHSTIVDEVVKLASMEPPRISMETAQKILGRGHGEVERILSELDNEKLHSEPENQSGELEDGASSPEEN